MIDTAMQIQQEIDVAETRSEVYVMARNTLSLVGIALGAHLPNAGKELEATRLAIKMLDIVRHDLDNAGNYCEAEKLVLRNAAWNREVEVRSEP